MQYLQARSQDFLRRGGVQSEKSGPQLSAGGCEGGAPDPIFLTKKWTSAVCGGGANAPLAPSLATGRIFSLIVFVLHFSRLILTLNIHFFVVPSMEQIFLPPFYFPLYVVNPKKDCIFS